MKKVIDVVTRTIALACTTIGMANANAEAPAAPGDAAAPTVEVTHFWISHSESNALDVYRRAWKKLGGNWIDIPTQDKATELKLVSDRISNGYPPTVMQWNANEGSRELPEMGIVQDIEEIATADHWRDFLPANVVRQISFKNHIYFAPTNIHAENWIWSNKKIFDELKLPAPTSWAGILASAKKIKAAGYTPIALGNGAWEISLLFNDIVYSELGATGYKKLMSGDYQYSVAQPELTKALGILRGLSAYATPSTSRKTWADAALSVGQGKAAMQFMGDYAKGELSSAGYVVDKDYRCNLAPGTESVYFVVIDAFAFPLTSNARDRQAQLSFAREVMGVDNQLAFNQNKGSIPVRVDIQRKNLDSCGKIGLDLISRPQSQVSAQSMIMPSQMAQGWIDVVSDYFNNPKITPEVAQQQLAKVLSQK